MPKPVNTATVPAPRGETFNPFDLKSLLAGYDDSPEKPAEKPPEGAGGGKKPPAKPVAAAGEDDEDEPTPLPAKKNEHSAKTIRMGLRAGLSEEEMAGMELDDLADEIVFRNETARHRAEGAAAAMQTNGTGKTSPETDIEKKVEDFGGADLDDVHDGIVQAFKHMAARIAALEAGTSEVKRAIQERDTRSADSRLDELFRANPTHFGDKSFAKTPRASKEMAKKKAVISYLNGLTKDEIQGLDKDFVAACEALGYTPPVEAAGEEEEEDEAQKWANAGLAKPSPRKDPPKPKGPARATDAVAKMMERAGIAVGGDNGHVSLDDFAE